MNKWFSTTYLSTALLLPTLLIFSPSTKAGVEAIQLDLVALDASVQCNRVFFRSSQHFRNTIFVVPRVIAGAGPDGRRTFDISSTEEVGKHILSLRLYFPSNDEHIKGQTASQQRRDFDSCNWDKVKASLNRLARNGDEKVERIARMPVTSIDVTIPGIKDVGRIGRSVDEKDEVDILNYYGTSLTAFFTITENEKAYFLSQILNPDGLATQIKLRFQAKQRDGSVTATLNTTAIQASFSAAARGKTTMTRAEVQATLRGSMNSANIQITTEASRTANGNLDKVVGIVIEQIMKELSTPNPSPNPTPGAPEQNGGDQPISVRAVLEILASKVSKQVQFQNIAAPETATAQTEVRLKSNRIDDPNLFEIEMKANYADPTTPFMVRKGETVAISPGYTYIDKIEYVDVESYLTTSQIEELGLHRFFPTMTHPSVKISNQEVNGVLMAVGKYSRWADYRWVRTEKFPKRTRQDFARFETSLNAQSRIPVVVSFTGLGNRFMFGLNELATSNAYFDGKHEPTTGRILITAKENLGAIQFREKMVGNDNLVFDNALDIDFVVEEKNPFVLARSRSAPKVLKSDDEPLKLQRTIVFTVTKPFIAPNP